MPTRSLTRDELYTLVWAQPVEDVARDLGLSGPGLGKLCRRVKVPVPYRGYWARKAAGQALKPTPLPPAPAQDAGPYTFGISDESPPTSQEPASELPIEVDHQLTDPHPLVAQTKQVLERLSAKEHGVLWNTDRPCLDVTVAPESLDRALRILDALVKACEARGYRVASGKDHIDKRTSSYGITASFRKEVGSWITVDGEAVCFCLEEGHQQITIPPPAKPEPPSNRRQRIRWTPPPQPTYAWKATGVLSLKLLGDQHVGHGRRTWSDGKHQRVEGCLGKFLDGVRALAEAIRAKREAEKHRLQQEQDQRQRQEKAERRRQAERQRRFDLQSRVNDWTTAQDMHDFISAVEATAATAGSAEMDQDLRDWLTWARSCAESMKSEALTKLKTLRLPPDEPYRSGYQQFQEPPKSYWESRHWWQR